MTIKIFNDRIEFGEYTLRETGTGFTFDGKISANTAVESFQGTVAGFTYSGTSPALAPTVSLVIDKFFFASDSVTAVSHGTLTVAQSDTAGQSSATNGYATGGYLGTTPNPSVNRISRFPFSSQGDSIDAGDLTVSHAAAAGQSSSTSGYHSGANAPSTNLINKFPFATDLNASDVGNLTTFKIRLAGHSSATHGYVAGGLGNPPGFVYATIERFPFSTDVNATNVGNLVQSRRDCVGQSSATNGYTSGGITPGVPTSLTTIDSYLFSSETNIVDAGDLTQGRISSAGQSSNTHGYNSGGRSSPTSSTVVTTIYRFPFASTFIVSSIGNLSQARDSSSGTQV